MNIYMILCDELRGDMLGCMGNDFIKTPHIDELAKDCVVFENSYCNTPMCVPSRLSIATGRHAMSHGAMDNMLCPLENEVSIFNLLEEKGYYTANHGKFHGNVDTAKFGLQFSDAYVEDTSLPERHVSCFGVMDRETRKTCNYKRTDGKISLIMYGTRPSEADDTLDSFVTDKFIADMKKQASTEQPKFIRLSIMDPHTPYFPSEPYASMYDPKTIPMSDNWDEDLANKPVLHRYFYESRGFDKLGEVDYRKCKAAYSGLVTHTDDRIGKAIQALKDAGEYEDSLIIFTSDHGSMMGEHGFVEKWGHMYEPVMHTPLFIKFPQNQYGNQKMSSFVESIDVMPTILDILGETVPETVQGKSLMPYIKGETAKHKDEVYAQYYCGGIQNAPALMVRDAKWKLTSYPEGNIIEGRLMNDDPLKMSELFEGKDIAGELYNMIEDPEENINLFDEPEYAEVKALYLQKLVDWEASLGAIVETNTMPNENTLGNYILQQGENLNVVLECLNKTNRMATLKLK